MSNTMKPTKESPFGKLNEYTLEHIFILSKNPELSKVSMQLYKISQKTSTQVKYLIRNVHSKTGFLQSIFYSRYRKLAKKEELVIELVSKGVEVKQGEQNSIFSRALRYKMHDALYTMLRMFKKTETLYLHNTVNYRFPVIQEINRCYVIEPIIDLYNLTDIIIEFELYKEKRFDTFEVLLEAKSAKLDLVEDCGVRYEDIFDKNNMKIQLYKDSRDEANFDELLKIAIVKNQPKFTRYILEYKKFSEERIQLIYDFVRPIVERKNMENEAFFILDKYRERFTGKRTFFPFANAKFTTNTHSSINNRFSIFDNKNQAFGSAPVQSSFFGSANNNPKYNPPPEQGSFFGSSNNNQKPNPVFGATSLFGSANNNREPNPPPEQSSFFGSANNNPKYNPPPEQSGFFGSANNN
ncbi:hypothetical protein BB559_003848 [Furculomyces boomerangus]|uniref:Uncharacterized protein n=1 Tax=Furculomyces boomerangus TaxID=61424 RepID=A0A2T9YI92_9FUNG|nr:hypothetical protein BB559_003848 [Furculomyces boomerangus]